MKRVAVGVPGRAPPEENGDDIRKDCASRAVDRIPDASNAFDPARRARRPSGFLDIVAVLLYRCDMQSEVYR